MTVTTVLLPIKVEFEGIPTHLAFLRGQVKSEFSVPDSLGFPV